MATVKLNTLTALFQGKISGLVVARHNDGLILRRRPRPTTKELTAIQKAKQDRFRLAVAYAKSVVADPERRRLYAALALHQRRRIYAIALADFLRPPVIHDIDSSGYSGHPGDLIPIQTTDDFEVVDLNVVVSGPGGEIIEQGTAAPAPGGDRWTYQAAMAIPPGQIVTITVTARDHAGNAVTKRAPAWTGADRPRETATK
jgi:hypothetical protein